MQYEAKISRTSNVTDSVCVFLRLVEFRTIEPSLKSALSHSGSSLDPAQEDFYSILFLSRVIRIFRYTNLKKCSLFQAPFKKREIDYSRDFLCTGSFKNSRYWEQILQENKNIEIEIRDVRGRFKYKRDFFYKKFIKQIF